MIIKSSIQIHPAIAPEEMIRLARVEIAKQIADQLLNSDVIEIEQYIKDDVHQFEAEVAVYTPKQAKKFMQLLKSKGIYVKK